jgi:hypothetical protein
MFILSSPAIACLCIADHSPCQALEQADRVALVEAVSVVDGDLAQVAMVRVIEAFKRTTVGEMIEIRQPLSTCGHWFKPNERHLIFLDPPTSAFPLSACTGSAEEEHAADALMFLRAGAQLGNRSRLSIWFENWQRGSGEELTFSGPASGVEVVVRGAGSEYRLRSNANGVVEQFDLQEGTYVVSPLIMQEAEIIYVAQYGLEPGEAKKVPRMNVRIAPGECSGGGFVLGAQPLN